MSEKSSAGAKELPGQTWVPLVVVLESVVQLSAPVDRVDHLRLTVVHICRDMDRAVGDVDRDAGEVLVGREDHPGVSWSPVLVVLVSILREIPVVLIRSLLFALWQNVQLLGIVVGVSALLQSFPSIFVVLVVECDVLSQLHDPLDGVDLVLHHDLHLDGHLPHHRQPVNLFNPDL